MRLLWRILISILFLPCLLIVLVLTSVKFQLLSYNFVTQSLVHRDAYASVPGLVEAAVNEQKDKSGGEMDIDASGFADKITPALVQQTIERNLGSIYMFIDGESNDVTLYIPAAELGLLKEDGLKSETFQLSTYVQPEGMDKIRQAQGIAWILSIVWLGAVLVTVSLVLMHFLLGSKHRVVGTGMLLFLNGALVLAFSLAIPILLPQAFSGFTTSNEPSQHLIAMFAKALIPDILLLWTYVSASIVTIGTLMLLIHVLQLQKQPFVPIPTSPVDEKVPRRS